MLNIIRKIYSFILGPNRLNILLAKQIKGKYKILDAGCGRFSPLQKVKVKGLLVGIDLYLPYIIKSKSLSFHDEYILGNLNSMPFKLGAFDCVIATEILEHFNKDEGITILKHLEDIGQTIILTTPNGFLPTYPGPDDNPDEKHLSGWTIQELKALGFQVYGIHGLKYIWQIRNGQAVLRKPVILFALFCRFSEFFVYHFPKFAFTLFCVK